LDTAADDDGLREKSAWLQVEDTLHVGAAGLIVKRYLKPVDRPVVPAARAVRIRPPSFEGAQLSGERCQSLR
jgi:hypothetical protein